MSTSKIIGEVDKLYASHGGCIDSMKAILAIDYAVECSVLDVNELNTASEKGCIFVARDGTIYDGVSAGEESEAHYKIVPTGLITKFNNVPLLASFYKNRDKQWQGVYVGTLDKLFETYKEFYKGQHDFSEQYINLCYGNKPLLNVYGFGLLEVLENPDNYSMSPKDSSEEVYKVGDADSAKLTIVNKLDNLYKSLERAQTQLNSAKLSKAKRRKLETRINQIKADIEKEETLKRENEVSETKAVDSVTVDVKPVEAPVTTVDTVESEVSTAEEVVKPRRGRKPGVKSNESTQAKKRTKAEIEEELDKTRQELNKTRQELDICKDKLNEANSKTGDNSYSDTYVESLRDKVAKLESDNNELNERIKSLLATIDELNSKIEKANKPVEQVINTDDTHDGEVDNTVATKSSIKPDDITIEASEIMADDFMATAGIKSACDIIYNKLLDKERWVSETGENYLKFYIKPLMQFVYNAISNAKVGDPTKVAGNGYVFSNNRKKLLINTNLIDCYGNDVYIIDHTPTEKSYDRKTVTVMQSKSSLVADGFAVEAIRHLPDHVKFFDKSEYIFDASFDDFDLEDEEHLNHIINERRCRFPSAYRDVSAKIIADKLKSSIAQAIHLSGVDYRYIMPMYNPKIDELEFLIPFYLDNHYGQRPELAIIVSKKQSFWKVFTVLKSEYAYFNARLLSKPDSKVF